MKKLLLVIFILISSIIGQTDNIGSEAFNETADRLFHAGNEKDFSDGTYLFKSSTDRSTVDTSGMFITDTTVGAAVNSRLLQGGQIITSTAADINLLSTLASDGYSVVIDSSGWMVGAPRTIYGWSNGLTFSATDHNTIAWTSGYLIFANLDSFAISAGNTGDITAATWVYLDPNVSTTVLQTTTSAGLSVGLGRVIVCVCEDVDSPKKAVFQVMGGEGGGLLIVADNIAANAITANELAANSVTTSEIVFGNMGDSLFWSINSDATGLYINADKLIIGAGTTFNAGYDISDNKMVIYAVPPPATRPSGDALQTGDQWIADSTGGNIPKIWTGSAWETAFTYINGGYIETGTVDADRIDVSGLITAGSLIVSADNISDLTNDSNYKTVFTSEPTAPYYVGDLWTDGSDLYYCDTEQLTGAYDSNDWSLATNYDPDTNTGALVVRSDSRPDSTNYSPGDVWIDTNDGDKPYTLKDDTPDTWIKSYTIIDGGDITTGTVDADRIDVAGVITAGSLIVGGDNLSDLTNDELYVTTFIQAGIPTSNNIGDIWIDSNDNNSTYRAAIVGANEIKAGEWITIQDGDIADAQSAADDAQSDADDAQTTADLKTQVIRADEPPAVASYSPGDIWIDTNDGDRPHTLEDDTPDIWVASLTIIDGGNISTGTVDADYLDVTGIFAENIEITGSIYTDQKTSFDDADDGFWLGMDGATAKFDIGNSTKNLKWDGSNLYVNDVVIDDATQTDGTITAATIQTATGNVDKIVLDASGMRVYDWSGGAATSIQIYDESTLALAFGPSTIGATSGWGIGTLNSKNLNFGSNGLLTLYGASGISVNSATTFASTLDAPTLNTGQGDNELYDMNQNVETGNSPTFVDLELTGAGLTIEESAAAPAHSSGHGKIWVDDATSAPLMYTTYNDQDLYVVTAVERTSVPGSVWPGRIHIDTDDNHVYIYADGGWVLLASW